MNGPIWPKIDLIRDFMDVLATCKYAKDPIINEVESNSEVNSLIWPEFQTIQDFMAVLVTCKFASLMKIQSKVKSLSSGQHFLHYKSTGKFFDVQE